MIISIRDVPAYERHLLFCSKKSVMRPRRSCGRPLCHLDAVNRSLAIHGEAVEEAVVDLECEAWPTWSAPRGAA